MGRGGEQHSQPLPLDGGWPLPVPVPVGAEVGPPFADAVATDGFGLTTESKNE